MFEKTSRLAEQVATSVSRRGFLGSLGGWAAMAALGVAGVLASGSARADSPGICCLYIEGRSIWLGATGSCPATSCDGFTFLVEEQGKNKKACCRTNTFCCP
jgi:hypothetical protein